jgi:hypothetical protein
MQPNTMVFVVSKTACSLAGMIDDLYYTKKTAGAA